MSANTTNQTIINRSFELGLQPQEIERLVSGRFSNWRSYLTDPTDLELHELLIIFVLSPAQLMHLFPRSTVNIFSLSHPLHKTGFRTTAFQQMTSNLAASGFLCFIKDKTPLPPVVIETIALICSGAFFDPAVVAPEFVYPRAAMSIQQIHHPQTLSCVSHVCSLFTQGAIPAPVPFITKIDPLLSEAAAQISSLFNIDFNGDDKIFAADLCPGIHWQDFKICLPFGERMVLGLKYSLTETNMRAALRLGMRIPMIESVVDISRMNPGALSMWAKYTEWYYSPSGQEPADHQNSLLLFKYYLERCGANLAILIPKLLGQKTCEYLWTDNMLLKIAPSGIVTFGKPIEDVRAVLQCAMDAGESIPSQILELLLTRLENSVKIPEKSGCFSAAEMQGQILAEKIESPRENWVDQCAWASVLRFSTRTFAMTPGPNSPLDFFSVLQ